MLTNSPFKAKIGRNDPCWCGSGQKYKRCHLGREQMSAINPWDSAKEIEKARSLRMCLHPEAAAHCRGGIVRAHSVQERVLRMIARDGHVYASNLNAAALLKNGGNVSFAPIGVNKASRFSGMCGHHDDKTFAPLEKRSFSATPEQCFLLAYRAICRELLIRRRRPRVIDVIRSTDRGRSPMDQAFIQANTAAFAHGSQLGADDLEWHKMQYDKALTEGNFEELKSLVLWLNDVPTVMCSSLTYPEFDFDGSTLQRLDSPGRLDLLTYTSIGYDGGGAVVFSWLRNSDTSCQRFVDSLVRLPLPLIPHAFIRLVFGFCENIFLSPTWWEGLSQDDREGLRRRMQEASLDQPPSPVCLADDGRRIVDWQIASLQAMGGK
jgi:SEC-C motif-containing protein